MGTIAEVTFDEGRNGLVVFVPYAQSEQWQSILKMSERHRFADDLKRATDKAIDEKFGATVIIVKPDKPGQVFGEDQPRTLWEKFCSASADVSKDNRVAVALVREDGEELVITAADVETGTSHRFEISAATVNDPEKLALALEKVVEQVGEAAAKAKAEKEASEQEAETEATPENETSTNDEAGDEEATTSENEQPEQPKNEPKGKGKKGGKGKK